MREAKNRFGALVEAARRAPQTVTKHGKPAVVILDAQEYARLKRCKRLEALGFKGHLLAMPTDGDDVERLRGSPRATGL